MAWVIFIKDHDYPITKTSVVSYKKGMHLKVKQEVADDVIKSGHAEASDHEPSSGDATDGTQAPKTRRSSKATAESPVETPVEVVE